MDKCKKCGKPLGVFDGNICNECENRAVVDKIRAEIEQMETFGFCVRKEKVLQIIDKYR